MEEIKKTFKLLKTDLNSTLDFIRDMESKLESYDEAALNQEIKIIGSLFADYSEVLRKNARRLEEYVSVTTDPAGLYQEVMSKAVGGKKKTKTDTNGLSFDAKVTADNVVQIVSNHRCPHIRSCSYSYTEYAREVQSIFYDNMKRIFGEEKLKIFESCYMIFVHHYIDKKIYRRDTDNYMEKPISDAVSHYFVFGGDNPERVKRVSMAIPDEKNFTEIYLVPVADFSTWICEFEKQKSKNNLNDFERIMENFDF